MCIIKTNSLHIADIYRQMRRAVFFLEFFIFTNLFVVFCFFLNFIQYFLFRTFLSRICQLKSISSQLLKTIEFGHSIELDDIS